MGGLIEMIIEAIVGTAAEKAVDKWIKPNSVLACILFSIIMLGLLAAGIAFLVAGETVTGIIFMCVFAFIIVIMGLAIIVAIRKSKAKK